MSRNSKRCRILAALAIGTTTVLTGCSGKDIAGNAKPEDLACRVPSTPQFISPVDLPKPDKAEDPRLTAIKNRNAAKQANNRLVRSVVWINNVRAELRGQSLKP